MLLVSKVSKYLLVQTFVKFSSKELNSHNREYQPEHQAHQQHVEDRRDSVHQGIHNNLDSRSRSRSRSRSSSRSRSRSRSRSKSSILIFIISSILLVPQPLLVIPRLVRIVVILRYHANREASHLIVLTVTGNKLMKGTVNVTA